MSCTWSGPRCRTSGPESSPPVDWPARFRAAAEIAEGENRYGLAADLRVLARQLEARPSRAIERALLNQEGQ